MNLIIVESPTKARTLSRFLGDEYQIEASMGHVRDLPKSTLGVDIEHDFAPEFVSVKGKEKTIASLKAKAKGADTIILATDPDREGEAIAFHVGDLLKLKSPKRIVFHEITKEAIEEALQHPRTIDKHLVDAQTARRVLDRLVGYKLSPLLWQKVRRGLSAGRVQSVAVRLIVEREREIEKFKKEPYWTIVALLQKLEVRSEKLEVPFELVEINGEKIEEKEKFELYDGDYTVTKTTIDTQKKADDIIKELTGKPFTVSDVLQKETKRSPYAPFTTSTLAQEASRRFGFTSKRTMSLAQKLYEEGFITYHRTDSITIAKQALFATRNFIEKEYGKKYVNESPRMFKTKQKLAQEAHEAIRPTNISNKQEAISNQLGGEHARLYELIWNRAVASQMSDAILESTTVIATTNSKQLTTHELEVSSQKLGVNNYTFKATGSVVVFEGFLKLYPQALSDQRLPTYTVGEKLTAEKIDAVAHETPPPPRYNEASLIATMEEKGIGRPSTYAPIISTIQDRQYVERDDSSRFGPTNVGIAVNDFLVDNFPDIDDIPFTAEMEDGLDAIAQGEKEWVPTIKTFYRPFEKKLATVKDAARVKIAVEETNEMCPQCKEGKLVIRVGRFGKFLSCSRFPECKFTKSFSEDVGIACPLDGGKVVLKKTRRRRNFYGCSNYPTCKFAAWRLEDIKKN